MGYLKLRIHVGPEVLDYTHLKTQILGELENRSPQTFKLRQKGKKTEKLMKEKYVKSHVIILG